MYKKLGAIIFFIIIGIMVITPLLTLIRHQPTVFASIKSWSMVPQLSRGDIVFLLPVTGKTNLSQGQIITFYAPEYGVYDWTMHRIVGGDPEKGFITRGDANAITDQEGSGYPPIRQEWIAGVVPALGSTPLKIPLIGYIPLWLEEQMRNPVIVVFFLVLLAIALFIDEISKSKKRHKKETLQKHHLCFMGGVAFAILMAAVMLMGSLFITFPYGVDASPAVLMGSDVGVLEKGSTLEVSLAKLQNNGGIPSFYVAVSDNPQVQLEQSVYRLQRGEETEVKVTIYAKEEGSFQSSTTLLMFLPFLPPEFIDALAGVNIWLAFTVIALLPALPLFVLPYLEVRFRRRFIHVCEKRLESILNFVR